MFSAWNPEAFLNHFQIFNIIVENEFKNKSNRGVVHVRGLAPGQHSSEETSQWWRDVGDTVIHWIGSGIEPQTFRTDSSVRNNCANRSVGKLRYFSE